MELLLTELQRKDEKSAIQFAIKGMHFDWYMESLIRQLLYEYYGENSWLKRVY